MMKNIFDNRTTTVLMLILTLVAIWVAHSLAVRVPSDSRDLEDIVISLGAVALALSRSLLSTPKDGPS